MKQSQPKPTSEMTDNELMSEFKEVQQQAKKQGEHLPLPVTRRWDEQSAEPAPIHRPSLERHINAHRTEQQKLAQVAKNISKGNSAHNALQTFFEGIGAMVSIERMVNRRALENARTLGLQGGSLEDFQKIYGHDPDLEKAFMEGYRENMRRKRQGR